MKTEHGNASERQTDIAEMPAKLTALADKAELNPLLIISAIENQKYPGSFFKKSFNIEICFV